MMTSQTPPRQRRKRKHVKSSERGDGKRLESPPSQAGAWPSVQWCKMSALFFNIPASRGAGGALLAAAAAVRGNPPTFLR